MRRQRNVFTIPASAPFLPALIDALLSGQLVAGLPAADDPLAITRATLYLPTRRACRVAEAAFAAACAPRAILLPRLVPLGDVDEDTWLADDDAPRNETLPPAIPPLTRRLLLARLVGRLATSAGVDAALATSPAATLALADELASLMDRMAIGRIDWAKLDGLVPDDLDPFFQISARFLAIVAHTAWPQVLAARGEMEPMHRRDRLVSAEAQRIAAGQGGPVIAAGSTGSIPATRDLLTAIAAHPNGAVVLPGLDLDLDARAWDMLPGDDAGLDPQSTHPQFGLHQLLAAMGIARDEVRALAAPAPHGRERLLSEAMRPASSTDAWQSLSARLPSNIDAALDDVTLIAAADPQEEALVAAAALREILEHAGRTAALITPDRALARRVASELTRWNIAVDDSAGIPLADTAAGVFARLLVQVAAEHLAPVPLAALLDHALARFGLPPHDVSVAAAALERAVLRGPRPGAGLDGLAEALAQATAGRERLHPRDPRRSGWEPEHAKDLLARLRDLFAPLLDLQGPQPLATLVRHHRDALLAATDAPDGSTLAGADAQMLLALLADIEISAADAAPMTLADYADLVPVLMRGIAVRPPFEEATPIRILGPLEARLVPLDRVVLAGLVEGTWPPDTRTDPWLNRPMRMKLGLDLPERRIGLSAHDFAQAFGAREVIVTVPSRAGGAPSVRSRFLQRLATVAGREWEHVESRGRARLALVRTLDPAPAEPTRVRRPSPAPPLDLRPTRLSVTEIADWVRDPYTIYARHVLRLAPLDPLDAEIGVAERGTLIHDALAAFLAEHPRELPADALERLLAHGRTAFAAIAAYPELHATWWPRFERIARWFVDEERARRASDPVRSLVERRGEMPVPGVALRLSARADRLDIDAAGLLRVIDYKTGTPPSAKQVTQTPFAPQLPLEAALISAGAFMEIPAGSAVSGLAYVHLTGGDPAGNWKTCDPKEMTIADLAQRMLDFVAKTAAHYADPAVGYTSLLKPLQQNRHGDYDHLARVAEWSVTGGEGGDEP